MAASDERLTRRGTTGRRAAALVAIAAAAVTRTAFAQVADSTEAAPEIRQVVEEVLSRAEYTGESRNPVTDLLWDNPVGRWIQARWQDFWEWITGLGGDRSLNLPDGNLDPARFTGLLLIALFTLGLVALVVYRLASTRDSTEAKQRRAARAARKLSARDLERMADEAEASGDFESAVRYRFRAGLARIDTSGTVEVAPSMTTGDVRRSVALAEFDAVSNVFEVAAFSEHDASAEDVRVTKALWDDVFRVLDPNEVADDV